MEAAVMEKRRVRDRWLERVNFWRSSANLRPVIEDRGMSEAALQHAKYLVENHLDATKNSINVHTEDPHNPLYSPEGAAAAAGADVLAPFYLSLNSEDVIDAFVEAPFHRLFILDPALKRFGSGSYRHGLFAAVLYTGSLTPHTFISTVIEFPSRNSSVPANQMIGELPNPLTVCKGYRFPVGLPITLELGGAIHPRLSTHRLTAESGFPLENCAFTAESYFNSDAQQQARVRSILNAFGAVVMMPRYSLAYAKTYSALLVINGRSYGWSFSIAQSTTSELKIAGR